MDGHCLAERWKRTGNYNNYFGACRFGHDGDYGYHCLLPGKAIRAQCPESEQCQGENRYSVPKDTCRAQRHGEGTDYRAGISDAQCQCRQADRAFQFHYGAVLSSKKC